MPSWTDKQESKLNKLRVAWRGRVYISNYQHTLLVYPFPLTRSYTSHAPMSYSSASRTISKPQKRSDELRFSQLSYSILQGCSVNRSGGPISANLAPGKPGISSGSFFFPSVPLAERSRSKKAQSSPPNLLILLASHYSCAVIHPMPGPSTLGLGRCVSPSRPRLVVR